MMVSAVKVPAFFVFRKKTGCRQYTFDSKADLCRWLRRKPYCLEVVTVCETTAEGKFGEKVVGHASTFAEIFSK